MANFHLNDLKKIISPDTSLIFGYFREAHKQLLRKDDPYFNIQPLIVYTCLAFYHIKYEWDTTNLIDKFVINGDSIESVIRGNKSRCLKNEITAGIHKFTFQIINYNEDNYIYHDVGIGIVSSEVYEPGAGGFIAGRVGFGYYALNGEKKCQITRERSPYGVTCKVGDRITMIVDLEKYELRYKVNDEDLGVAFTELEPVTYRVGLYMYGKGTIRIMP